MSVARVIMIVAPLLLMDMAVYEINSMSENLQSKFGMATKMSVEARPEGCVTDS